MLRSGSIRAVFSDCWTIGLHPSCPLPCDEMAEDSTGRGNSMSTSTRLEEERKHFDDVAEKWDVASIVVNDEIVPQPMVHFKRVIEAQYSPLHELSGKRVLDCGCGVGMSSVYVAKHGAHVTAFDISPKSIE